MSSFAYNRLVQNAARQDASERVGVILAIVMALAITSYEGLMIYRAVHDHLALCGRRLHRHTCSYEAEPVAFQSAYSRSVVGLFIGPVMIPMFVFGYRYRQRKRVELLATQARFDRG